MATTTFRAGRHKRVLASPTILRLWWLQYRLQCSEVDLAGIERESRALNEERRSVLQRNLLLRSALRDAGAP